MIRLIVMQILILQFSCCCFQACINNILI